VVEDKKTKIHKELKIAVKDVHFKKYDDLV